MKVYACPDDVKIEPPDYKNYNLNIALEKEKIHKENLKKWLIENGYKGKNTGSIVSFPVADGYAKYMFAEGKKSFLIHLPYGDAYNYRHIEHIPKKTIIELIEREENMSKLFNKNI